MPARNEHELKLLCISRAERLGRLINLSAPSWILARELALVTSAVNELFKMQKYDPALDPRATIRFEEGDDNAKA